MADSGMLPLYFRSSSFFKIGSFSSKRHLDFGDNGHMFVVTGKTEKSTAMMKISDRRNSHGINLREISKSLASLRHPHVIKLYESIVSPRHVIDILEYPSAMTLQHYTLNFEFHESEARRLFQQIISAVDYCHRKMIIHRDVTLENFLLDVGYNVKLISFSNSAVKSDGNILEGLYTTKEYRAPELNFRESYLGPEVDIWCCGVCLMLLTVKGLPVNEHGEVEINAEELDEKHWSEYFQGSSVRSLLQSIFQRDPKNRATMQDIINHPWFQENLPAYLHPIGDTAWVNSKVLEEVHKKCKVPMQQVYNAVTGSNLSNKLCLEYNLTVDNWRSTQLQAAGNRESRDNERRQDAGVSREESGSTPYGLRLNRGFLFNRNNPNFIMDIVYCVLKELNFEWKVVNDYHLVVRKRGTSSDAQVKMNFQLYNTYIYKKPYTMCISSLPQSTDSGETSERAHKVMAFLEESSRFHYSMMKQMGILNARDPLSRRRNSRHLAMRTFRMFD